MEDRWSREEALTLDEYQDATRDTAAYSDAGIIYTVLGLVSEAGEVADILKKRMREEGVIGAGLTKKDLDKLADELGDVLWYVANVCFEAGLSLDSVAQANLSKLRERKDAGRIKEHN